MRYQKFLPLALLALLLPSAAEAKEIPKPNPLAICGPENPRDGRPSKWDVQWSANCLVAAIKAHDREALFALSEKGAVQWCAKKTLCRLEDYIFDRAIGTGRAAGYRSLWGVLARIETPEIRYSPFDNGEVLATFITDPVAWKKEQVKPKRDYFECSFGYDKTQGMWVLSRSFCFSESDADDEAWLTEEEKRMSP